MACPVPWRLAKKPMGQPVLSGRIAYRTTGSAAFAVVGEILGGLFEVWAKVKALARRKRRDTETRRIQTSCGPGTGFLRTPRLYSCDRGASMGLSCGGSVVNLRLALRVGPDGQT